MEVAYVSEFVGDMSVFRQMDAPGLEAMAHPGTAFPLDQVYCRHILAGRLPELMGDTTEHPLAMSLPITQAVPIRAHMSVPIRLPNGEPYGMFCCLSRTANPSLTQRDLQVMRVFADLAAHEVGRSREAEREQDEVKARIGKVIADGAFGMLFQPIVQFSPFRVVGFEALCRFAPKPYRSPDKWFAEAADCGMGVALELAVLRLAIAQAALLPRDVFVSVNASPETILSGGLDALFDRADRPLVLEVTEHAQVADYDALRAALEPLRRAGVRLAIDDAGAGYSSLQHIIQLRPDIIKLDMSLTRSIDSDAARRALASALTFFAREVDSVIVAEGIETEAELATLQSLRVSRGQGYLLGRPGDLAQAEALLASASALA